MNIYLRHFTNYNNIVHIISLININIQVSYLARSSQMVPNQYNNLLVFRPPQTHAFYKTPVHYHSHSTHVNTFS
jgi:hypothetical protein